ncbi:MAG: type II toxin-antitoxin system RelE/ParE family toxin [Aeriscardovia sp.]|nr:type II toxin-antitoxin system RelE/ParE family toxin [Aeriscardovia sp.]
MKKIEYSPDAIEKIQQIGSYIATRFGRQKAKEVKKTITKRIRDLAENEYIGESVEALFGIPTDYRVLFVAKNYIFYRVTDSEVLIVSVYNEREDFMFKLFGISSIDEDAEAYWDKMDDI